jgi:hypothetical protein
MTAPRETLATLHQRRGWQVTYAGATTRCPGCTRSNWLVGRTTAECAFCGAAIGLPPGR